MPDVAARERLCAHLSMDETVGEEMLGYVFDIVLRGRSSTPKRTRMPATPSGEEGPFSCLRWAWMERHSGRKGGEAISIAGRVLDGDG